MGKYEQQWLNNAKCEMRNAKCHEIEIHDANCMHSFGQTATRGVNKPNIARMFKRSNNPLLNCWMPKIEAKLLLANCIYFIIDGHWFFVLLLFFLSEPPTWLLCGGRRRRRLQFSFVIRDTFAKSSIAQNATNSLMLTIDFGYTLPLLCTATRTVCIA